MGNKHARLKVNKPIARPAVCLEMKKKNGGSRFPSPKTSLVPAQLREAICHNGDPATPLRPVIFVLEHSG